MIVTAKEEAPYPSVYRHIVPSVCGSAVFAERMALTKCAGSQGALKGRVVKK